MPGAQPWRVGGRGLSAASALVACAFAALHVGGLAEAPEQATPPDVARAAATAAPEAEATPPDGAPAATAAPAAAEPEAETHSSLRGGPAASSMWGQPPSHLEAVLNMHNKFRCMHGVPWLRWNSDIEAHAKNWVASGRGQRSPYAQLQHVAGFGLLGENIQPRVTDAGGSRSAAGAVQLWYHQIMSTDKGRVDDYSWAWAKYAQIVWASTTDIGCALYDSVLICQYGIAGNEPGRFVEEVRPPVKSESECRDLARAVDLPGPWGR